MKRTTHAILTAGALALAQFPLYGAVIFDNLSTPTGAGTYVAGESYNEEMGTMPGQTVATGFVVGGARQVLTSVVLGLGGGSGGGFQVALFGGSDGTSPGSLIASLTGAADPSGIGLYTYTPGSTTTLEANTTYYIVASAGSGAQYSWNRGQINGSYQDYQNPGTSGSFADPKIFVKGGGDWGPSNEAASMQVNGELSPVPEPTEWAAASVAMLGLVYVAKRRLVSARQ